MTLPPITLATPFSPPLMDCQINTVRIGRLIPKQHQHQHQLQLPSLSFFHAHDQYQYQYHQSPIKITSQKMHFSTILTLLFTTAVFATPMPQPQRQGGAYDVGGAFSDLMSEGAHQAGHLTGDIGMSFSPPFPPFPFHTPFHLSFP